LRDVSPRFVRNAAQARGYLPETLAARNVISADPGVKPISED
jgi:hypothetical protein